MKITAQDLKRLGVIDEIIPEPVGGAHRARAQSMQAAGEAIERALAEISKLGAAQLKKQRREKFLAIGRSL